MRYIVINLARSKDRLDKFMARWWNKCSDRKIERFEAFDAKGLVTPYHWKSRLNAYGCYMSHYLLACSIANTSEPVVVFEDDAYIRDSFDKEIEAVVHEAIMHDVDLLYLGGDVRSRAHTATDRLMIGSKVMGAYAFVIMPKFAKKYVEVLSARPTNLRKRGHYHGDVKMIHSNRRFVHARPHDWLVGHRGGMSTITETIKKKIDCS